MPKSKKMWRIYELNLKDGSRAIVQDYLDSYNFAKKIWLKKFDARRKFWNKEKYYFIEMVYTRDLFDKLMMKTTKKLYKGRL